MQCDRFSVEVKHGRQIPRTLLDWFEQAERNAENLRKAERSNERIGPTAAGVAWLSSVPVG